MDLDFKSDERELLRLVTYFKKRAEILIIENRLGEEYRQLFEACDTLAQQLQAHVLYRTQVSNDQKQLQSMVNDHASCPQCQRPDFFKKNGIDLSPQGWKSNRYRCRKCNITFVWTAPNNPWDMIPYVEDFVARMELKTASFATEIEQAAHQRALAEMKGNLEKLKPVVQNSDQQMKILAEKEILMADLVRKFKKQLLIEKIRFEE